MNGCNVHLFTRVLSLYGDRNQFRAESRPQGRAGGFAWVQNNILWMYGGADFRSGSLDNQMLIQNSGIFCCFVFVYQMSLFGFSFVHLTLKLFQSIFNSENMNSIHYLEISSLFITYHYLHYHITKTLNNAS